MVLLDENFLPVQEVSQSSQREDQFNQSQEASLKDGLDPYNVCEVDHGPQRILQRSAASSSAGHDGSQICAEQKNFLRSQGKAGHHLVPTHLAIVIQVLRKK